MTRRSDVVLLFDVDNTLLDNDAVRVDLHRYLGSEFGIEVRDRYWVLFEELRMELGYADYLGALQRYRLEAMTTPQRCACLLSSSTIPSLNGCTRRRSPYCSACAGTDLRWFSRMATWCFNRVKCSAPGSGMR